MRRRRFAAALLAALACDAKAGAETPVEALAAAGCPLAPGPIAAAARVIDADTIALDDETQVRLLGSLAPRPAFSAKPWRIEKKAETALSELVAGRPVALGLTGRRESRYGQKLAQVFIERDGVWLWVQGEMLERGLGRAYGLPGNFGCMGALLARERKAREKRAGLWADRAFQVLGAEPARALSRLQGTFQIVTGEVRRVERVKGRLYVNFGDDWRQDFTAGAALETGGLTAAWAAKVEGLVGRPVEVRGWIERRFGPYVEIWDPAQLEAGGDPPSRAGSKVRAPDHE